jgi:hypothetical protein
MRSYIVVFVLALLLSTSLFPCFGADSATIWVVELGEISLGMTRSVIETADGGFAVVGAKDGGFLLMKLDRDGDLEWERVYGAEAEFESFANDVLQTPDGGFLLAGRGTPWPNFMGPNGTLFNLIRVNAHGNVEWERIYGTRNIEAPFVAYAIVKSSRGGYAIVGYSEVGWSPVASGSCRIVLIKIDEQGNVELRREYPSDVICAYAYLAEAGDGGYAILTLARSYHFNHFCYDDLDYVLIRTDPEGNIIWRKQYNYTRVDDPKALVRALDDFLLAGNVLIHENKLNCSVIKVDEEGNVEWTKVYSGLICSATTSRDGVYLLAMKSPSGGVILKINSEGGIEWDVRYEGDNQPALIPYHVVETMDGAYAFTGAKAENPQTKVLVKFKPPNLEEPAEPPKNYLVSPATITAVAAIVSSILLVAIIIHLKKRGRAQSKGEKNEKVALRNFKIGI